MSEAPKVWCNKEKKEVPIWYCVGSFVQQRVCPYMNKATIFAGAKAEVDCSFEQKGRPEPPIKLEEVTPRQIMEKVANSLGFDPTGLSDEELRKAIRRRTPYRV